jgi:hypothetical protein
MDVATEIEMSALPPLMMMMFGLQRCLYKEKAISLSRWKHPFSGMWQGRVKSPPV